MRSFCAGANLRWLMSNGVEWPSDHEGLEHYEAIMDSYRATFGDSSSGIQLTGSDLFDPRPESHQYNEKIETRLSDTLYARLLDLINSRDTSQYSPVHAVTSPENEHSRLLLPYANYVSRTVHRGVTYAKFDGKTGNSYVLFRPFRPERGHHAVPIPGQIQNIVLHRRKEGSNIIIEPFLVVQTYKPLTAEHRQHDPFQRFPHLDTSLYYNQLEILDELVPLDHVVSHFAAYVYTPDKIDTECMVVRSLCRVCASDLISAVLLNEDHYRTNVRVQGHGEIA